MRHASFVDLLTKCHDVLRSETVFPFVIMDDSNEVKFKYPLKLVSDASAAGAVLQQADACAEHHVGHLEPTDRVEPSKPKELMELATRALRALSKSISIVSRVSAISLFVKVGAPIESRMLISWITLMLLDKAEAVCPHCKDSIPGCPGGDACPTMVDPAANAAIFNDKLVARTPKVTQLLPPELAPHFSRTVCEALVGIVCAPAPGTEIDFTNAAYSTARAVVRAACLGHCTAAEASQVLQQRLEEAVSSLEVDKIRGAMDSLKLGTADVTRTTQGALTFIWGRCSSAVMLHNPDTSRLEPDKSKRTVMTATVTHPESQWQFFAMLQYFITIIVALGAGSYFMVARFVDDTVYNTLRMGESWRLAYSLMRVYHKEIDRDTSGTINMSNVFRRGGQDTYLAMARKDEAANFRGFSGKAIPQEPEDHDQDRDAVKTNGRYNVYGTPTFTACVGQMASDVPKEPLE